MTSYNNRKRCSTLSLLRQGISKQHKMSPYSL